MCIFDLCFQLSPNGPVQILKKITIYEIISLVGFVIAIVSLIIAVRSSKSQAKTRRAEFSFRVWESFIQDDVQTAYLEIEWGNFNYPYTGKSNNFESKDQERRVDKLLYLLDEMALLYENKILEESDKERWLYHGKRVYRDSGVKNYMKFLDEFFKINGIKSRPHGPSRRVFSDAR